MKKKHKDPATGGDRKLPKVDVRRQGQIKLPERTIRPNAPLKKAVWGTGKSG